ncbi:MAG: hypothetical protein MSIBF_02925 [Candidatus Altiarchaeales archaeon IMC4]|nr:MAG: hypothetical protein MSIBF_02925 [Candidatus Altiarchaeales archaeon IMC4]
MNIRLKTKGQGALEYITTYGWAILVVMIAGLVMWQLGIFGGTTTPTRCEFSGGVKAVSCVLNDGSVGLIVSNMGGQNIKITKGWADDCTGMPAPNIVLGTGDVTNITISGCSATTGNFFSTTVYVNYTSVMTTLEHTATGTISGTVE